MRSILTIICLLSFAPLTAAEPAATTQGYLYIEPYQVRFEALFDAATLLHWLDPGTPAAATLSAARQKDLTDRIAEKAGRWCRLAIESDPLADGVFHGASIVKGKPGNTLPLDPGAEIATAEAMVGLVWEFPSPPIAEQVTLEWKGFIAGQSQLPIRVFFGPKSEVIEVSAKEPSVQWRSQGRMRAPGPLAKVPDLVAIPPVEIPLGSAVWAVVSTGFFVFITNRRGHFPFRPTLFIGLWLLGFVALWPLFRVPMAFSEKENFPAVTKAEAAQAIVTPLLRNVYRAFDQRSESAIYDTLARSVDGELLRRLYLETIQALTLDGREGTRVTIQEFDATVKSVHWQPETASFVADCEWTALGTVGHWGHTHTRVNRYTASVTTAPIEREWKIVKLDVTEARRL